MIIYLYVKQHTITGLKYFGKTINDPYKYDGSGVRWNRHINKHGKDNIQTLEVFKFDNQEDATKFALNFSEENNIVESLDWANAIPENAKTGGVIPISDAGRLKLKTRMLNNKIWVGRKHSAKTLEKFRQNELGNTKGLGNKSITGQSWYYNEELKLSKPFHPNSVPIGWMKGRRFFT